MKCPTCGADVTGVSGRIPANGPERSIAHPCGHTIYSDPDRQDRRPWGDERGFRQRHVRPFLMPAMHAALDEAARREALWSIGLALGLTDDEMARLEAQAIEDTNDPRYGGRLTVVHAMRCRLADVARGEPVTQPELTYEHAGVLTAHARRLCRLVVLDVLARPFNRWAAWRDRRRLS